MKKKILVVDDERDICEILTFNLEEEGYEVDTAASAEEALKKLKPEHDLILLDVMMDGMSGYRMAEKLRKEGDSRPIVFLTAKDTENDMLTGFSVGGDDYISKPFSLNEVSARVKAVLKRTPGSADGVRNEKLTVGELILDPQAKELRIGGEKVYLTKTEFEILSLLAFHPSRIFAREEIIDRIWKDAPYVTERTVDVHITRLRKKMGNEAIRITNRAGYGYKFDPEKG
jgi:DNA-binding response OmpR family regulator